MRILTNIVIVQNLQVDCGLTFKATVCDFSLFILIVDEDLKKTKVRAKTVDSLEHEISVTRKKSNTYTYSLQMYNCLTFLGFLKFLGRRVNSNDGIAINMRITS